MKIFPINWLLFVLSTGVAVAENIAGSNYVSGNWIGSAYTFDTNGEFSHCGIYTGYKSGDTLHFTVNRQASVTVAVESPGLLQVPVGEQFPVTLNVDRRAPFFGTATILLPGIAALEIPNFDRAMDAFKKGYTLVVEGAGRQGMYDLTGTFRALEATRQCAQKYYNYAADVRPVVRDKTQMFQLATMVISELGINSFRFLNQKELVDHGWENSVAWTSPEMGVSGWSLIIPRVGVDDLKSTDAADVSFVAGGCGGDFATSARGIELGGGTGTARELRILCRDGDESSELFLSKFFAGSDIVYNLIKFEGSSETSGQESRQQQSESATLRAASFISE